MFDPRSVRLIVSDLDGTLLHPTECLTARTAAVLVNARNAGIKVVAATGRTLSSASVLLPLGTVDLIVSDNGASVFDPHVERIERLRLIAPEDARRVFDTIRAEYPRAGFGWATPNGVWLDRVFLDLGYQLSERSSAHIAIELDGDAEVTKLFIGVPGLVQVALQRALEAMGLDAVTVSTSGAPFVEASVRGCDKATTLAQIANDYGIGAQETVAFGDQMNDIAMLRWAGHGVAMSEAHPEVLRVANELAASNREDGVATVIERLLAAKDSM